MDITAIKLVPILEIAKRLGIKVRGSKAMCFSGHDKATPSLTFSVSRNSFHCFGACGKYGGGIQLVMDVLNIDFMAAVAWIAHEFNIHLDKNVKYIPSRQTLVAKQQVTKEIITEEQPEFNIDSELYGWLLSKCNPVSKSQGVDYLASHAISPQIAFEYGVRELVNPDYALQKLINRWGKKRVYHSGIAWGKFENPMHLVWSTYTILFPIYENDSIIHVQGRLFEGNSKYLDLRGLKKPLYNSNLLKTLRAGSLLHICEGIPDTIALLGQGLNAIGVLGSHSFREEWVDLLRKYNIVLLGDGDAAGDKFKEDVTKLFAEKGKSVRSLLLPRNLDVADVLANKKGN